MEAKLKNIDFIRIIACVAIILFHLLYDSDLEVTKNGNKAVDLFFIIAGFCFVYKLNLKISLFEFIKHKIIRLYPVLIFAILLIGLLSLFGFTNLNLYNTVYMILGLSGTGLHNNLESINYLGHYWFCSSLLWVLAFYFYLVKNFDIKHVNLFTALAVFFCYSFILDARHGIINGMTDNYYHVFNLGLMRAMGGIGIGYLIGNWYKSNLCKFESVKLNLIPKIFLSVLEFVCLYFVISNLTFHDVKCTNHFIFIIVYMALIILFLYKKGFVSRFLDKNIFVHLGKYTYSIFVTHFIVVNFLCRLYWKYFWNISALYVYPIIFIICILFGIITYHIIENPVIRYLNKKNPLKEEKSE